MPNEMNHAELAERLEFIRADGEVGNAITLTQLGLNTLADAAADERRIANGELAEVVHGHLQNYCSGEYDDFAYCSVCGAKNLDESNWCRACGADMNEFRDGNSLNGKDDSNENSL